MVVVFLRIVERIQPITRLLLHSLHTFRRQAVVEGEVEVVRDQEDQVVLEKVQTLDQEDQEGPEEVQILDQVVVEEDMEALVVAVVGQQNQISQVG